MANDCDRWVRYFRLDKQPALLNWYRREPSVFGRLPNRWAQASGTASRIAGTQLDTLKGDFTILLSALEGVGIAIGEAFVTQLRSAVRGITALLSIVGEWIQQNRQVIVAAVAIVAGVITLGSCAGRPRPLAQSGCIRPFRFGDGIESGSHD